MGSEETVANILKLLVEERAMREESLKVETARRAEELRLNAEQMRSQMDIMREMMDRVLTSREEEDRGRRDGEKIALMKLSDSEDIEAYLTTFERVMTVQSVPEERWAYILAPQLTGKAQQAFAALSTEAAGVYKDVRTAILRRYNISEETY